MRNIVLITLDALRADHCGFMGYERNTTPTLDRMAKNGLYFENAIASSIPTAPSMFSCFTGEFSSIETFNRNPGPWRREFSSKKTLASSLHDAGYNTIAVHKHPWASKYYGFDKGFDYFSAITQPNRIKEQSDYSRIRSLFKQIEDVFKSEYLAIPWENYYGEILEKIRDAKRPYFLWVFLLDTHMLYLPPKKYKKWSKPNIYLLYLYWKLGRKKSLYDGKILQIINAYDDEIRYSDCFINRLREDLKSDDPIFVIHADHGDGLGEHGFYGHEEVCLYEELIHVPLVIYNAMKGKVEEPITLRGLAPVILKLIGGENEFSSESFLEGGNDWVISKVFDRGKRKVAVRMKNWKFITGQKDIDELYNLEKDPREQENLIDEHPKFVEEMRNIVENHIKHETEIRRIREKTAKIK
jgi:arylsulfatase